MTAPSKQAQLTWVPAPVFLTKHSLVSKNTFYGEIKRYAESAGREGIPHIRVGRKIFVPENVWALMLAANADASTVTSQ